MADIVNYGQQIGIPGQLLQNAQTGNVQAETQNVPVQAGLMKAQTGLLGMQTTGVDIANQMAGIKLNAAQELIAGLPGGPGGPPGGPSGGAGGPGTGYSSSDATAGGSASSMAGTLEQRFGQAAQMPTQQEYRALQLAAVTGDPGLQAMAARSYQQRVAGLHASANQAFMNDYAVSQAQDGSALDTYNRVDPNAVSNMFMKGYAPKLPPAAQADLAAAIRDGQSKGSIQPALDVLAANGITKAQIDSDVKQHATDLIPILHPYTGRETQVVNGKTVDKALPNVVLGDSTMNELETAHIRQQIAEQLNTPTQVIGPHGTKMQVMPWKELTDSNGKHFPTESTAVEYQTQQAISTYKGTGPGVWDPVQKKIVPVGQQTGAAQPAAGAPVARAAGGGAIAPAAAPVAAPPAAAAPTLPAGSGAFAPQPAAGGMPLPGSAPGATYASPAAPTGGMPAAAPVAAPATTAAANTGARTFDVTQLPKEPAPFTLGPREEYQPQSLTIADTYQKEIRPAAIKTANDRVNQVQVNKARDELSLRLINDPNTPQGPLSEHLANAQAVMAEISGNPDLGNWLLGSGAGQQLLRKTTGQENIQDLQEQSAGKGGLRFGAQIADVAMNKLGASPELLREANSMLMQYHVDMDNYNLQKAQSFLQAVNAHKDISNFDIAYAKQVHAPSFGLKLPDGRTVQDNGPSIYGGSAGNAPAVPTVSHAKGYAALNKGDSYIGPDGHTYTKGQ